MTKISFRALSFADLFLMHQWFNYPHVQQFYSLRSWTEEEVQEKLKPYILGEQPVLGFIIYLNEQPIGYIQYYYVSDYPWPKQNLSDDITKNAAGMDLFIGDSTMIGKGLGSSIIQSFLETYIWPKFQYCIVDPDITNQRGIRCYEKLGFKEHVIIETVDALKRPTKLKLMILKQNLALANR